MSQSTDGILAYGYDLGGDEEWKVQEAGEYGEMTLDWFDGEDEDGFIETAEKRLLAASGFTETDWQVKGYFERERAAKEALGVEFETYCSGDYPMYILAAKTLSAARGYVKDATELLAADEATRHGWDQKLADALKVLGMTPKQEKPTWLLCSYWG